MIQYDHGKGNKPCGTLSADGSVIAIWNSDEALTVQVLDYQPKKNDDDRSRNLKIGEFKMDKKTQADAKAFTWLREENKFLLDLISQQAYDHLADLGKAKWAVVSLRNFALKRSPDVEQTSRCIIKIA